VNEQVVSGIALPSGSSKLYTGSKDETVRAWDCQSGQVGINFLWRFFFIGFDSIFQFLIDLCLVAGSL
jgi:WD40 repeat protein